ncbi:MAG: YitT family protein [Bacillota bacterium]|nr:YitT family protein [Bacillota bacterium]
MFRNIKVSSCIIGLTGSIILAFGLYHVHSCSGVTEGGVLGMTLLLQYWFHISPAVTGFVLNSACYLFGAKQLGKEFIFYSALSTAGFSLAYKICEQFDPLWPQLYEMPLLASVAGALFVGVGAGLCVRIGGAPSGDDALAMSLSELTHIRIQWVYLLSDFLVLALSVTYIPLQRLGYSVLTVILSGQIIGLIQRIKFKPALRHQP